MDIKVSIYSSWSRFIGDMAFWFVYLQILPLMNNWHKTKSEIEKFAGKKVMLVYGKEKTSYRYYDLLKLIYHSTDCYSVAGADHNFANMDEEFRELILFFVGHSGVD